ncbi:MAG: GNAT family N-acetyltransferase [Nitrososphaerota archaeon]|jgi:predicted acetyltransferase|nr:GNAT family N-acetyltransferase [Nitrososphaerota archaeon]
MSEIDLQIPTIHHKAEAENFKNEFFEAQEQVINGSALLDQMDYEPWLINITNNRQENTIKSGWVVSDTFFAVNKLDNRIIGIIDIRHNLNNDALKKYFGHIGYAVRPSERKKGYATKILKMGLEYAKTLHIEKVMLSCYTDNTASIKTIERCNGKLTETKPYTDGKPLNTYWIKLK